MSRVYIAVTREQLARYLQAGLVPGSNEYFVAEDESEDAELEAYEAAVVHAGDFMLEGPGRRYVLAVEVVAGADGTSDSIADMPWSKVHALHADTEDVDPAADELPELGWYATQEIPDLLA
ncbi:MAG: DUF6912 family protein [Marmoricola sp.]